MPSQDWASSGHGPIAVIMGLGVTGLAVARALGRRGIPIVAVSDPGAVGAESRYLRFLPGPSVLDDEAALHWYLELGRSLDRPAVLVPTGDPSVLLIARHREAFARHFRFHVADTDSLEAIASKRRLVALAERLGLPVPPTILPVDHEDLKGTIDCLRFPCVIKPEYTHLWRSPAAAAAGVGEVKAIPVQGPAELLSWYDRLARIDPRLIVQQMVVGPDENHLDYHALVDPGGTVRAEFVGRKHRLAPAHYGSGCYVESIHAPDVRETGRAVLERLAYRGMANLNFKRDVRDGRLYLFEINPRFSIWTSLDVACGVDFPYYYYQTCLGEPYVVPADYPTGIRWLNPLPDLQSMRVYLRDGTWTRGRWLASVLRASVNAVFAWDDPGPAWAMLVRPLRHRFARPAPTPIAPAD